MRKFGEHKFILNGKRPEACADLIRWGLWLETANRHVAQTHVGEVWVSTVFLGLDHNWSGEGAPVLFETMVFTQGDELPESMGFGRYRTWEEAEAGHAATVAMVKRVVEGSREASASVIERLRAEFKA